MKLKTASLLTALLFVFAAIASPPLEEGKAIFTSRCAACHNIHKDLVGPALAGVDQRRSLDWIISFVHSPGSLIKKGDTAAVALFDKFNKVQMPDHPDLTPDNIKNVVEYIKAEAGSAAEKATAAKAATDQQPTGYKPLTAMNYGYLITFAGLGALLTVVLVFAFKVKQYERQMKALKK